MEMPDAFKVNVAPALLLLLWIAVHFASVVVLPSLCFPLHQPPLPPVHLHTLSVLSPVLFAVHQECYIEEDMSSLTYVARAIMDVQRRFGVIPNLKCKGVLAKVRGCITGSRLHNWVVFA